MTQGWWRVVRDLVGRGGEVIVEALAAQTDLVLEAATVLRDAQHDAAADAAALRERLDGLVGEGEGQRARIREELARTLTTPIDPEDIQRVARSVEDVLGNLQDFAIELLAYDVAPHPRFAPLLDALVTGAEQLSDAVASLGEHPREALGAAQESRRRSRVREAFHEAMAELLVDGAEVDTRLLRVRELLRRLDVAGLRLDEAADALASGALKRR